MEIRTTGYGEADAQRLIAEVQQEYVVRYGEGDLTTLHEDHFDPPGGHFVVGYLDGLAVACGGWRAREGDGDQVRDGDAELKRMYVAPAARGKGFARAVLRELEESAAEAGRKRLILETGTKQPEAIALYESSGYQRIKGFGYYKDYPDCVCMAKELN